MNSKLRKILKSKPRGFTYLETVVAMVVLSIAVITLSVLLRDLFRSKTRIDNLYSLEQVRFILRMKLHCANTMDLANVPAACPPGTPVPLKGKKATLVDNPSTTFGDFSVRAQCADTRNRFRVEYRTASLDWTQLFNVMPECPQ